MAEYRIAGTVLESIVKASLAGMGRLTLHLALPLVGAREVEVEIEGPCSDVTVHVDARLGEDLPALAQEARARIADALDQMAGLTARSVNVVVAAVLPCAS